MRRSLEGGYKKISPFFIPMLIINLAPGHISIKYGAKGPNISSVSACATGTHSIGDAYPHDPARRCRCHDRRRYRIDGHPSGHRRLRRHEGAFRLATMTRRRPVAPSKRTGTALSWRKGPASSFSKSMKAAKKRGAKIYAEVVGYGLTGDAYHLTAPAPGGEGAARCMKMALRTAGVNPEEVDYINAHGTSTPFNDLYETMAIKSVFGDHASKVMVTSTKTMTGHLPWCRRRHGGGLLLSWPWKGRCSADHQLPGAGSRVRSGLCPEHGPRGESAGCHEQLLRFRRHQRHAALQEGLRHDDCHRQ